MGWLPVITKVSVAAALSIFCSTTLWAGHSYGGLDLCTLYPERMPPGLPLSQLPQPTSQGAKLAQQYCQQCHKLPGPGRHTVDEWPAVMERMNLLMDVASQFGGLMGKIQAPSAEESAILQSYLESNALQALAVKGRTNELAGRSFTQHCGSCHALPDPTQHNAGEWPQVIQRMQRNMQVMKHEPLMPEVWLQIQAYLQANAEHWRQDDRVSPLFTADIEAGKTVDNTDREPDLGLARWQSWVALGPFLLFTGSGAFRWWRSSNRNRRSNANSEVTHEHRGA